MEFSDFSNAVFRQRPDTKTSSLLNRQGIYVLPSVLIIYIVMQILVGYNDICTVSTPFAPWTRYYYFAAGFSFITSSLQQMNKIFGCWRQNFMNSDYNKGMFYLAAISVSLIAGSSCLLTYSNSHGGICRDVLGIDSSAAQWSEWLTSVPLMAYIAVAVEDKIRLTKSDYMVIGGLFLAVLLGAMMNLKIDNYAAGIFLFLCGCLSLIVSFLIIRNLESGGEGSDRGIHGNRMRDEDLVAATKKASLSRLINVVFPAFPILYLVGYLGRLNRDQLYVGFVLLSVIAKLLFVSALIDEQVMVTEEIKMRKEAEIMVNETRRSFLRYVFHELRIPLNTITMGMAVIENDRDDWREALKMMNGATSFINKTLNDVLFVHEIEEGELKIAKKAFHIESVVADAIRSSRGLLVKNVRLVLDDSDCCSFNAGDCPLLMGDRLRLKNVIMSFIENAVTLSSPLSVVTIKIMKKYSDIYFPSSRVHRVMNVIANSTSSVASPNERKISTESALDARRSAAKSPMALDGVEEGKKDADAKTEEGSPSRGGCLGLNHTRFGPPPIGPRDEQVVEPRPHYRSPTSVATRVCEVQVTVTDTGMGVSKEDLEGLLRPYSQIRPDHFEQGRGTGLWLVLAKEIINLHGGEVIIDSVVGKGSTFGFSIPFDIATRAQERNAELLQIVNATSDRLLETSHDRPLELNPDRPPDRPSDRPFHRPIDSSLDRSSISEQEQDREETTRPAETTRKYLVVDDTPSNSKMLAMLLRGRNIQCDIADNGLEALNMVKSNGSNYDLVFMDFTMPVMNGGDATAAIRESGFNRLIFGLTGNALNDDVTSFLHSGADCVLAKPLRAAQMEAVLSHARMNGFQSSPKVKYQMETISDQKCTLRFL